MTGSGNASPRASFRGARKREPGIQMLGVSLSWPYIAIRRTACFRTPMFRPSRFIEHSRACLSEITGTSPVMTDECLPNARVPGEMTTPLTRHSGTARERRTRNPDPGAVHVSGFRVRAFARPGMTLVERHRLTRLLDPGRDLFQDADEFLPLTLADQLIQVALVPARAARHVGENLFP